MGLFLPRIAAAALLLFALTLVACGDDNSADDDPCQDQPATCAGYEAMGPHPVGVRDVEIEGHQVAIFYPATDELSACSGDFAYDMRQFLPADQQDEISDDEAPFFELRAHLDAEPAADQQFPLVLFSHGLAGYRFQSSTLLAHMASWGMVVASAEQPERNLARILTEFFPDGDNTPETMNTLATVLLDADGDRADLEPITDIIDGDNLAATGHSMGGNGAQSMLQHPAIDAAIFLASDVDVDDDDNPHGAELMWQAGGTDGIIRAHRIRGSYDEAAAPKSFINLEEAGHLAFSDICAIGADEGGILQIAQDAGIDVPTLIQGLADDGCRDTDLQPHIAWPIIHHYAVAHLRLAFGIDDSPQGLDEQSLSCFDDAQLEWDSQP